MSKPQGYEQAKIDNFTGDNKTWLNILMYAAASPAAAAFTAALLGLFPGQ
jgi:hypothetical protein